MQLRSSNKAVLGIESLDNRVMPSVGVTMPQEAPGAGPVQISHFNDSMGALKKVKIDAAGAFSIDILSHAQANGATHGGNEFGVSVAITRQHIGEEIPQ